MFQKINLNLVNILQASYLTLHLEVSQSCIVSHCLLNGIAQLDLTYILFIISFPVEYVTKNTKIKFYNKINLFVDRHHTIDMMEL